MNKESFMQELARLLGDISPQERQEALNFYEEYFHDAGPEKEQEVLKELGSPMQVAAKMIAWFSVLISLIAAFGAAALTCMLCGIAFVVMGFTCMFSFPYVCLIMAGSGLICVGIGILFMMLTVWMCAYALPGCCRGIACLWKKSSERSRLKRNVINNSYRLRKEGNYEKFYESKRHYGGHYDIFRNRSFYCGRLRRRH